MRNAARHRFKMRTCLLMPPKEADQAADFLSAAADAILTGEMGRAADLLRKADIRTLHSYAAFLMSPTAELLGFDRRSRPPRLAKEAKGSGLRMPTGSDANAIFERDGYRCRYCGCRVIRPGVRSLLSALFPDIVVWPGGKGGDQGKHAAFFALSGVLDHVEPYARGGDSSALNIVTACWPCNFGKEDYTIQELCLGDPRHRQPTIDAWDGLARLVRTRRKPAASPARPQTPTPQVGEKHPSLDDWLALMAGTTSPSMLDALRDLLISLQSEGNTTLSIRQGLTVNIARSGRSLGIFGISPEGDIDVPWMIDRQKEWFRPFAESIAQSIPAATLYETPTMWRVDGCGRARGQITIDELVGSAAVVCEGVKRLAESASKFPLVAGGPPSTLSGLSEGPLAGEQPVAGNEGRVAPEAALGLAPATGHLQLGSSPLAWLHLSGPARRGPVSKVLELAADAAPHS